MRKANRYKYFLQNLSKVTDFGSPYCWLQISSKYSTFGLHCFKTCHETCQKSPPWVQLTKHVTTKLHQHEFAKPC